MIKKLLEGKKIRDAVLENSKRIEKLENELYRLQKKRDEDYENFTVEDEKEMEALESDIKAMREGE